MPPAGFEPAIPAREQLNNRALDCAAEVEYYKSYFPCKQREFSVYVKQLIVPKHGIKYRVSGISEIMP